MTLLDAIILISTLLVFVSLIEVLITTSLESNKAKKIDRYSRVIFPLVFAIASVVTFVHARG